MSMHKGGPQATGAGDDVRFVVRTRSGAEVAVMAGPSVTELSYGQRQQLERESPSRGRRRRGPDLTYNCHGMTFVNRMGWVGAQRAPRLVLPSLRSPAAKDPDSDVLAMLTGNGYCCTCRVPNYQVDPMPRRPAVDLGDVILYRNRAQPEGHQIGHSGIVVAVEEGGAAGGGIDDIKVLSKMGMAGEYLHSYRDAPEVYGRTIEIWSDREDVR